MTNLLDTWHAALNALRRPEIEVRVEERSVRSALSSNSLVEPNAATLDKTVVLHGQRPAPRAWLLVREGKLAGNTYDVDGVRLTMGRTPDNDVILSDRTVSQLHAQLRQSDSSDGYLVMDLGSTNGTFKRGTDQCWQRVDCEALCDGDVIRLGALVMSFHMLTSTK